MEQKTRYAYLRYITNSYKQPDANTRTAMTEPVRPEPVPPAFTGPDDPRFTQAMQNYTVEKREFSKNKQQPVQLPNGIIPVQENLLQQVKFIIDDISYSFDIGNSIFTGLSQSDFINWYIKPISISLKGDSVVSTNPYLTSDNIVLNLYKKLKQELSELNYNYFKKPRFLLYIDGGLQGLDTFTGVITSFNISENASIPDKFDFDLKFIGKPIDGFELEKAITGFANDNNILNAGRLGGSGQFQSDPLKGLNNVKIGR